MVLKTDIGQQKWQQMTQRWLETAIKSEKGANTIVNSDSDMTSLTRETAGFDIQTRDISIPQPLPASPQPPPS